MTKPHSSEQYIDNLYKKALIKKGLLERFNNLKKGYSERIKEENGGETRGKRTRRPYVC